MDDIESVYYTRYNNMSATVKEKVRLYRGPLLGVKEYGVLELGDNEKIIGIRYEDKRGFWPFRSAAYKVMREECGAIDGERHCIIVFENKRFRSARQAVRAGRRAIKR